MTKGELTSVWEGTDWDLLPILIPFWLRRTPEKLLDTTYGQGRFWRRWEDATMGRIVDSDLYTPARYHDDYQTLSTFQGTRSYDVVVFDPPHFSEKHTPNASGMMTDYYGDAGSHADATSTWPAFLRAAHGAICPDGILVAKISDQVHRGRQRLQGFTFCSMAEAAGWQVCDLLVKVRPSAGASNWERQLHLRKRHSWFICLREKGC